MPTQSWAASHIQWNGGECDGFVRSIEQTLPGQDATAGLRELSLPVAGPDWLAPPFLTPPALPEPARPWPG